MGGVPDLDLFDKTELWLVGVTLDDVRLPELAATAAEALGLSAREVFVTDVRDDYVVLDVLAARVRIEDVVGRGSALLAALGGVPGVTIAPDAEVHSRGVLGILGAPAEQVAGVLAAASKLEADVRAYVARRVAVVSTGAEVGDRRIHDSNVEVLSQALGAAGYEVAPGGVVDDDERAIAGRVARLAEDGFGVIVTTGGVGAEDKDRTIEALQLLVPDLATAVLATYEVGHGRHVKPHVRVAAGVLAGDVVVVALPGPTREVRAAAPALIAALAAGRAPSAIAEAVAEPIRALWRDHDVVVHGGRP